MDADVPGLGVMPPDIDTREHPKTRQAGTVNRLVVGSSPAAGATLSWREIARNGHLIAGRIESLSRTCSK